MLGAVIGDIIGSTYEWHNVKTKDFDLFPEGSHFTDDTVLCVAVADALLHKDTSAVPMHRAYAMWYRQYYRRYKDAGFGQMFSEWAAADTIRVQRSFGNGAAMRAVPIGYAMSSIREVKGGLRKLPLYPQEPGGHTRRAGGCGLCLSGKERGGQEADQGLCGKTLLSWAYKP